MGRKAQVRWYESKNGYYCTHRGVRHRLGDGPDDFPHGARYRQALARWQEIVQGNGGPDVRDARVLACLERWTLQMEKLGRTATVEKARFLLKTAGKRLGETPVSQLQPFHVREWLESQPTWGPTTRHTSFRLFKTCIAWNRREGYLSRNPIEGMPTPPCCEDMPRGGEFVWPDELTQLLLEEASGPVRDLLFVLRRTGARPSEIALAEHYHYRADLSAIVYEPQPTRGYRHKTARKTKKPRVIHLDADTEALIRERIREQGKGFIFRATRGGCFNANVRRQSMAALRRRRAVRAYLAEHEVRPGILIMYALRHTFATRALRESVPPAILAEWMGTSIAMLQRHYGHLCCEHESMHAAYVEFAARLK